MTDITTSRSGVDEGAFMRIGGQEQWVTIRGRNRGNPPLLILSGPGFAMSSLAPYFEAWEEHFTLVQWDQPGSGATVAKAGVTAPALSYARLVADGLEVAERALERLGAQKLALLATSGGTIIGLNMLRRRPDLFFAYVGNGQIVRRASQERLSYELLLERAVSGQDADAVKALRDIGPPPYSDIAAELVKSQYANAPTAAEAAAMAELMALASPPAGASYVPEGLDPIDPRAAGLAAYLALKQGLAAFDAFELGTRFETPMFFFQGAEDAHTVTSEVEAYAKALSAPQVGFEIMEGGGHMSFFLRDQMLRLLKTHVRPLAS